MRWLNTRQEYGVVSKCLHWLIALLVIAMLIYGFLLGSFPRNWHHTVVMLHKSFGLIVLALSLLRILWLWFHRKPDMLNNMSAWQQLLAEVVHFLLYIMLVALPLSGWIMATASNKPPVFFNWFSFAFPIPVDYRVASIASDCHTVFAWIVIGLIALHVLGALKHALIDKDDTLRRMC